MVVNPPRPAVPLRRRAAAGRPRSARTPILAAAGAPGRHASQDVLAAAADGGPRGARRAASRVGRWLGVGVANLVNVFNPEVVVFGGVLRQLLPATEAIVRTELASALAAPREQVRLALPQLGGDSTLLGAAEPAFAPLLDDPLGVLARGRRRHHPGSDASLTVTLRLTAGDARVVVDDVAGARVVSWRVGDLSCSGPATTTLPRRPPAPACSSWRRGRAGCATARCATAGRPTRCRWTGPAGRCTGPCWQHRGPWTSRSRTGSSCPSP